MAGYWESLAYEALIISALGERYLGYFGSASALALSLFICCGLIECRDAIALMLILYSRYKSVIFSTFSANLYTAARVAGNFIPGGSWESDSVGIHASMIFTSMPTLCRLSG